MLLLRKSQVRVLQLFGSQLPMGTAPAAPTTVFHSTALQAKKKKDDGDKKPTSSRDFYEKEEKNSRRVINNLTAGNNLGTIVYTAGILFIAFGFALNFFGLDYVVKDGRLTIGTVEERQFQKELNRVTKTKVRPGDANSNVMQMQRADLIKLDD